MNYFWIVIALVILLYIIYYVYRRANSYGAVRNAYLAKYTYDRLTKDQQKQIQEQTEELRRRGGGGMPLSDMGDMLKYSFYALGMAELGLPPSLPGEKWDNVKNPFLELKRGKSQMQAVRYQLENKHNVNIDLKTPSEAIEVMLRDNEFTKEADTIIKPTKKEIINDNVNAVIKSDMNKIIDMLVSKGKEKGYLSYDEINDLLPASINTAEQIDIIILMLSENCIEIVDNKK